MIIYNYILIYCSFLIAFLAEGNIDAHTCLGDTCSSSTINIIAYENGDSANGVDLRISRQYCTKTTKLSKVICMMATFETTCTVYSSIGIPIKSCEDIKDGDDVFMVHADRLFIWPSYEVGHRVSIPHVKSPTVNQMEMETISISPRVFRVKNFFSVQEAETLINNALGIHDDEHRLKRSSTGAVGYNIDNKRTSENAFDTGSEVAMLLKRRSFELLGIQPYDETYADGLQILRYNVSTAYISHMDWIDGNGDPKEHNWDSKGQGTNRFATILLYLSDVIEGGETVFPNAPPLLPPTNTSNSTSFSYEPTLQGREKLLEDVSVMLEERNISHLFPFNSWQRDMVITC
eukprot:gene7927-16219_t